MFDASALEESKLRSEVSRSEFARDLLDNPLIQEFFAKNESEIWEAIKTSPVRNVEDREKLLLMHRSMEKFRSYLIQTLETGKLASMQLESKRNALQRAKAAIWPD